MTHFIFPDIRRKWRTVLSLTSIVAIVGAWLVVTSQDQFRPLFLPKPIEVIREMVVQFFQNDIVTEIKFSLFRFSVAVVCGVFGAVLLGAAMTLNGYIRAAVRPAIYTFQFIPIAVFASLTIMALGIYESPKIVFIGFGVFMQLLPIVIAAIGQVEENYIRIGKCMGFTDWNLVRRIYLKRAAPLIYDGVRASLGLAWSFMVISEIITGDRGIGLQVEIARRYHQIPKVYCFVVVIAVMGLTIDNAMVLLRRRLFAWQYKDSAGRINAKANER